MFGVWLTRDPYALMACAAWSSVMMKRMLGRWANAEDADMSTVVMMADISLGIAVNDTRIARITEERGSTDHDGRGLRGSRRVHGTRIARITKGMRIMRITKGSRDADRTDHKRTRIVRITKGSRDADHADHKGSIWTLTLISTVATRRSDLVTMRHGG